MGLIVTDCRGYLSWVIRYDGDLVRADEAVSSNSQEGEARTIPARVSMGERHKNCQSCGRPIAEAEQISLQYQESISCPDRFDHFTEEKN